MLAQRSTNQTRSRSFRPSGGFSRVSPKRRCRICNHDNWCVYARDERTSVCMRNGDGAKGRTKPSPAGRGWIHVHTEIPTSHTQHQQSALAALTHKVLVIDTAPIEVRDAIYRELIRISPAS